jgi:FkbM family methyltransferase
MSTEELLKKIVSLLETEREFREDFERLLSNELRSHLEDLVVRERLFREDFERQISNEVKNYLDKRLDHYHLRSPVTFGGSDRVAIHTLDGQRLILDMHEPFMAHHIIEHGEWERHIRTVIKTILPVGGVFIDIGANIGVHSLLAASVVGPTGTVIALEPHPHIRSILRENIEINGLHKTIQVHSFAAAAKPNLSVPFQYFPQHPAMSGFRISEDRIADFEGTPETIQVVTTTLDSILGSINFEADLVKIDVEGFEIEVLRGAAEALVKNKDTCFLIEYSSTQVIALHGKDAILEMWEIITNSQLQAFPLTEKLSDMPITWNEFSVFAGDLFLVHPDSKTYELAMSQLKC